MSPDMPKQKRVRKEELLYEPVLETLRSVLAHNYVEREIKHRPISIPNPYLEITSESIPDIIMRELDSRASQILSVENDRMLRPDIMGFVKKKSASPKELVIAEIKAPPIRIRDVLQAKFYQDVFNPTFNLLVSPKGMPDKKIRCVLEMEDIRRKITITKFVTYVFPQGTGYSVFQIDHRFKNYVPEAFKNCINRE